MQNKVQLGNRTYLEVRVYNYFHISHNRLLEMKRNAPQTKVYATKWR